MKFKLIRYALSHRNGWCRYDENWSFGWHRFAFSKRFSFVYKGTALVVRVGYTIKAVVCVIVGRRKDLMWAEQIEVTGFNFRRYTSMDFYYGEAFDWTVLAVEPGLRHWYYDEYGTSST